MPSDRINDTAAAWFARLLSPDCGESDRENFERWCAADERHADAFAAVAQCHDDAAALKDDELMRAVARAARNASSGHGARAARNASSGHDARAARNASSVHETRTWPRRVVRFAAAAVVLLAIAGGAFWLARSDAPQTIRYATTVGEQRSISLADGTRVQLDTDTQFTARYGEMARELVLDRGRIRLDVAKDAKRAFTVLSGRGVIRDIGTQFQVARYGDDVTVTLMSGIVSVALLEPAADDNASVLAPGQQLRVGAHGGLGPATPVDLVLAAGWTSGTLTFRDRRLGDLLDEMNRYSQTKIRLADPSLALLQVSGVFRAGDQTSLLQALQTGWSIRSTRTSPAEVVLSSAH